MPNPGFSVVKPKKWDKLATYVHRIGAEAEYLVTNEWDLTCKSHLGRSSLIGFSSLIPFGGDCIFRLGPAIKKNPR